MVVCPRLSLQCREQDKVRERVLWLHTTDRQCVVSGVQYSHQHLTGPVTFVGTFPCSLKLQLSGSLATFAVLTLYL